MIDNGVMMQYFEWNLPNDGKLWNKLKADAAHLHDIGVTSVWIPPAYKADEQEDEGYATYDLFDLGEFDQKGTVRTKYGTKQELKDMIDELHKHQISVYLDAVMNHKAGGDYTEKFMVQEVNPEQRQETISDPYEIEAHTGFDFSGRNNKYSDFKWHWYHFSGTDYNETDKKTAIYKILGEGKDWSSGVDEENGNYDYLLCNDIDLDHPEVIKELDKWGIWVAEELNLDGMRLDAIKHMKDMFVKQFVEAVRAKRGLEFYFVGEYWNNDLEALNNYINVVDGKLNLFDVTLHYNMFQASQEGLKYDLQNMLNEALVVSNPQQAVTFVDNHDSQRGSSLESQVKDWFKPLAYGLILLMEQGYPCIFYGDYYGIKGKKSPHRLILDILLDARRKYAYGEQHNYFDHPCTAGFVRMGNEENPESGLAFLISNGEDGNKTMNVGNHRKGEVWYEYTGNIKEEVTIDEDGNGNFLVEGGNLAVWVKK